MAGSYDHVMRGQGGWSLIENMGDAYECVEELLFIIHANLTPRQISKAIQEFNALKRGELAAVRPKSGRVYKEIAERMAR